MSWNVDGSGLKSGVRVVPDVSASGRKKCAEDAISK